MSRSTWLVAAGLGTALVLLPLALGTPGLPMSLRADETSTYFLSRSLATDGDAVVDAADVDRIYREMPYTGRERLALGSDDGWQTARWAVSPLYSVLLVPATTLAKTGGAFAFNALCFVLALVLVGRRLLGLGAPDDASKAWTLAGGALLLSGAFVFVWWIHPASLRLLLVAAAFSFGWPTRVDPATYSPLKSGLRFAVAGACLGLCLGEVPWLAVFLPALLLRHRGSLRRLAALAIGVGAGVGIVLLTAWLVLGHVDPDAFAERAVYEMASPDEVPWLADTGAANFDGLRPAPGPATTAARLVESLLDPRRGLLLLFPFAALFVWATLFRRRTAPGPRPQVDSDSLSRLALAAGLAVLVLSRPFADVSALDLERYGDPLLSAAFPAFFFLPVALPSVASLLATVAVAALLLTPAVFTPFGPPVAKGDAHHATRGWPSRLPMGLEEVSEAAGWDVYELGGPEEEGLRLWAPSFATDRQNFSLAVLGGERVTLWIEALRPVSGLHVQLHSFAPDNRLTLDFASGRQRLLFPGESPPDQTTTRLPLDDGWHRAQRADGTEVWITEVVATTTRGERPEWRTAVSERYYVGARLTVLGSDDYVARDVFGVHWAACGAPPTAKPEEELRVLVRLRNTSAEPWLTDGPVSVRLAHRWRSHDGSSAGDSVVEVPGRSVMDGPVEPGAEALAWVDVVAPKMPGTWQLEIEPVFELVAWFSDRMDDPDTAVCRTEVLVEP